MKTELVPLELANYFHDCIRKVLCSHFTKDASKKISKWQILVIVCVQIILDETRGAHSRNTPPKRCHHSLV